jgi:hypothetical protein
VISDQCNVTLSRCHMSYCQTKKIKNLKNVQIALVTSVICHTVTLSQYHCHAVTVPLSRCHSTTVTLSQSHCHAVTVPLSHTKKQNSKIAKIVEFFNERIFLQLWHCNPSETVLCDIFDVHLKDGKRHGMDTYLLIPKDFVCFVMDWDVSRKLKKKMSLRARSMHMQC